MSKHDVLAEIKEAREDGFTMWEINKHQMDSIIALKSELAALEAERDEWKKRAEQAAHIGEDDKVGFDWNVLTQIESLEAVAEAAEEYTKVHGHNFGSGCACLLCEVEMALDALKGAE